MSATMALSAEYGFHLICSSSSSLACSFTTTIHNCFTSPQQTARFSCGRSPGSKPPLWLKRPILPRRRHAGQKLKWVQFTGYCTAQKVARDVSSHFSAEHRRFCRKCLNKGRTLASASSREFDPTSPAGMPFDLLSNTPTHPSSVDKQLSFKDGSRADNFISPRQISRSIGSRSVPSRPSIPGKFSKYSKKINFDTKPSDKKTWKSEFSVLETDEARPLGSSFFQPLSSEGNPTSSYADDQSTLPSKQGFTKTKRGIYTDPPPMPATDLPFEFQFSYSETPKVRPLGFREPQYSPFGPSTMPRPWTGRAPLPQSKKKVKELDSFNPPPKKKGIKPVHPPGPYKEGDGPKHSLTREEILGEPLTKEEITKIVESCDKEDRQINLGRDGLVHNMLDLIHSHWKRRRVIKFKCKGVPTVDMDNVCYHIEDKTGGKIIHRAGGAIYLFRGRNYNTKYRPHIPLMLWKPAAPIYPRLIVPAPNGLTKEEADTMRKRGRKVQPLCKLAKNGVYLNLVKDVRTAFEIDELVRIDCTGLSPSDYKKIGAKLKDLVPCVLLSFDKEQILVWRGKDWKSTEHKSITDSSSEVEKADVSNISSSNSSNILLALVDESKDPSGLLVMEAELVENGNSGYSTDGAIDEISPVINLAVQEGGQSQMSASLGQTPSNNFEDETSRCSSFPRHAALAKAQKTQKYDARELDKLWEEAVGRGDALELEESSLDPDIVLQKARTLNDRKSEVPSHMDLDCDRERVNSENLESADQQHSPSKKKLSKGHSEQDKNLCASVKAEPPGHLSVDELAKLLAS